MTQQKLRAYEVLLRMAQVREIRATAALARAASEEKARRGMVSEVTDARDAVAQANARCINGESVDLARYEMLSLLDVALAERLNVASDQLDEATRLRSDRANDSLLAKRYRERVDEQCDVVSLGLAHERMAKGQEEAVELWVESRKEGA